MVHRSWRGVDLRLNPEPSAVAAKTDCVQHLPHGASAEFVGRCCRLRRVVDWYRLSIG
jgi:hypothetical protein